MSPRTRLLVQLYGRAIVVQACATELGLAFVGGTLRDAAPTNDTGRETGVFLVRPSTPRT